MSAIAIPSRQLIQPRRQFELNTNVWEADGLVGWWPLGAYPDGRDMSLHGNHGTPIGGPMQDASGGRFGMEFDGVNDYVNLGDNILDDTSFTATTWFSRKSYTALDYIFENGYGVDGGMQTIILTTDAIRTRIDDSGANGGTFDTSTTITDANWYHLAVVADKTGNAEMYLNGVQDGATMDISGYGDISGTQDLWFGRAQSDYYDGKLDDVRIYNRALSSGEVSELYRTTHSGGYGRLAKPRVKYWAMSGVSGNWSWLNHLQNSPYGITQ